MVRRFLLHPNPGCVFLAIRMVLFTRVKEDSWKPKGTCAGEKRRKSGRK